MTITEINNLKIEQYFYELSMRLVPTLTPDKFEIIQNAIPYDGIMFSSQFTKPTLAEYEAEFALLKQELIDIENARLAEIARREALKVRISKLEDYHAIATNIGKHKSNEAVEYKRIIDENDEITLSELEAEYSTYIIKKDKKAIRDNKKEIGIKAKVACEDCLSLISGGNSGLTDAQIDQMILDFSAIYSALKQRRPNKAKLLISAIPNNGIIDELKSELLEELTEHGF